jgi:membrane fusion protein, multidrug efflux system
MTATNAAHGIPAANDDETALPARSGATSASSATPTSGAAPASTQSPLRRYLALGAIAVLVLGGYLGVRVMNAHRQTTDDAQVEADVVPVAVRVSGAVRVVNVADNALVKKDDVLLELDSSDWAARVKQAEGELGAAKAQAAAAVAQVQVAEASARGGLYTARAQVTASVAQVSSARAQIANAEAQLLRAQAEEKKTAAELERTRQLVATNALSQDRLDNAQAAYDAAAASVAAAVAQLSATREAQRVAQSRVAEASGNLDISNPVDAKIATARANAEMASARVVTAEAALELSRLNLSYTTVRAPAAGTISKLRVHEGQLLSASQPVAELVPEVTYLVANFKETQIGEMRVGQVVEVEVDALDSKPLHAIIASISGGTGSRFSLLPPDNASGNFVKVVQRVPVRMEWKELPQGINLRAGLSATATVHTGS